MPRKKKQEIVLEPKLEDSPIESIPDSIKETISIDATEEDLHGEFSHTKPIRKPWKRPLRRL